MDEILKKEEEKTENLEGLDDPVANDETVAPGDTSTPEVPELNNEPTPQPQPEELNPVEDASPRMFTQEEVNDLMGHVRAETRDRTFKYIYGRYGVEDENGLDDLVGNAQRYDTLKENTDAERQAWDEERNNFQATNDNYSKELGDLKEHIALLESGIDKERYDDAKFILKGKGLEITAETIASELATHPEWKKSEEEKKPYIPPENLKPEPKITVPSQLGNEQGQVTKPQTNEEDVAMEKYFKLK